MNLEEKLNIIKAICELQSFMEGYDFENNCKKNQLTIKLKILTYLFNGATSPYFLTKNIGIAKTNLNLICNELLKDNLISKKKEEFDKRVVSYSLTEKGHNYLIEEMNKLGEDFEKMNIEKSKQINEEIKSLLKLLV